MKKPLSNQEMFLFVPNLDDVFGTNYEEFVQSFLNSRCRHSSKIGNTSKTPYEFGKSLLLLFVVCACVVLIINFIRCIQHNHPPEFIISNILLLFFSIILIILYNIIYINNIKTKGYIKKYGEEYFRIIVRQTIELCLIRRYFGLFEYDSRHPFEHWYSSSSVHLHLLSGNNFTGRMKSYWNKDKDIKYNIEFKNGNEYGLWKAWYKNGQIAYEQNFKITEYTKSGIRHGKARCWNKEGKLIVHLNYIDGKVSFEKS